ncbi:uncharacterized protein LOC131582363 [Poecile atricapillus]|uniref:uncharacterized protein LOC131582237 n=1 Tax=Poecile atricapillus TaxID=48891 RepID=UPI0027390F5E|nr:uncharacterized protein LOC131582237 [Poecile atricapillus]XP_058701443.1 uncharacterized protein LOC131582363 [Poecile atricapillus]
MGRASSSDPDNLHCSKGRRNRLMDPLHPSQESPCTMGDSASLSNTDDLSRKVAFLIILLLVMTKPILVNGSIVVAVTKQVERMDGNLTYDQKTEVQNVQATWKEGADYPEANIVTVWGKDAQKKHRELRDTEVAVHQSHEQENLVVGLIRDFGKVQNVSRITACLPLPQAAGEPIPWGIIPIPLLPETADNTSTVCQKTVQKVVVRPEEDCMKLPNSQFTRIRGFNGVGWCSYDELQDCQNITSQTTLWDDWKTVWGPSLLEHYSYIGAVDWCIQWTGSKNQTPEEVYRTGTSTREIIAAKGNWNCTKVITCDTPESQISLASLRVLLKWGCECRTFNHTITGEASGNSGIRRAVSCRITTIKSPGNLVWVMGHGQWTTHIPIDGPVTQITLGIPTLCPLWKQSKLKPNRKKREVDAFTELENEWHEPDGGVKFGWALESLFAPVASYRNREMLYKLLGQTERLAAATKKGFKDMNLQLQATSRMTLQNRMALDMLLLKEHGVCQYLKTKIDHCCIHIPNVTIEVEKDISQLETIESETKEIEKEAQHNWIGDIFESLGLQVSGWVWSIVQYILLFAVLLLIIWLACKCVLGVIEKETRRTRRVIKALARTNEIRLNEIRRPPPRYEDVVGQDNPAFERTNDD